MVTRTEIRFPLERLIKHFISLNKEFEIKWIDLKHILESSKSRTGRLVGFLVPSFSPTFLTGKWGDPQNMGFLA